MRNFTMDTYETKREIVNFSKKLTANSGQVEKKFIMDMIYGIIKSGSLRISSVSDALGGTSKKINVEERLCRNLGKGISSNVDKEYLKLAIAQLGDHLILLVDDSDVVKKYGHKFESLGRVIDGSSDKKKIENCYYVSEIVELTNEQKHPISLSSHIHSSTEPGYKSTEIS